MFQSNGVWIGQHLLQDWMEEFYSVTKLFLLDSLPWSRSEGGWMSMAYLANISALLVPVSAFHYERKRCTWNEKEGKGKQMLEGMKTKLELKQMEKWMKGLIVFKSH